MDTPILHVEARTVVGRGLNQLRSQGLTPLVLYGKTTEPRSLQADTRSLERVVQQSGRSQLTEVRMGDEVTLVLFREIQRHPVRHTLLHVDAYALQMDETQVLQIPIVTEGELSSSISGEMTLIQNMDTITIETYPNRIPDAIRVDLGKMSNDHNFMVADLDPIDEVVFLHEPDEVVFSLSRSRVEDEDEVAGDELGADEDALAAGDADGVADMAGDGNA